jgi:hypothetical protein
MPKTSVERGERGGDKDCAGEVLDVLEESGCKSPLLGELLVPLEPFEDP